MKYHIKKDGTPGICQAKTGECPLGGSEQHFDSSYEANMASQRILEEKFGVGVGEINSPNIDSHLKKVFELGECQDYAVAFQHINGGHLTFINDNSMGSTSLVHAMVEIDGEYYDINGSHGDYDNTMEFIQEEFFVEDVSFYNHNNSTKALERFYGNNDFLEKEKFRIQLEDKIDEAEENEDDDTAEALEQLLESLN